MNKATKQISKLFAAMVLAVRMLKICWEMYWYGGEHNADCDAARAAFGLAPLEAPFELDLPISA
jgi:hypothetical protein